jgi:hypothetical protein
MNLKQQCKEFQVKLQPIADELGYSLPYVTMVLKGDRSNNQITSAVYLAIEERKKELRKLLN